MTQGKIDWHPNGTSGPWEVDDRMITHGIAAVCLMCEFDSFGGIHDAGNLEANQAAIAEVPAMVQVLKKISAYHGTGYDSDALYEEYYEDCVANEIVPTSSRLLDELMREVTAILARIDGTVP